MEVILAGEEIRSVRDVHAALATALDFGPFYGWNMAALWDRLSTDVARPVCVRWKRADLSKERLGPEFDRLVRLFDDVSQQDASAGLVERFTYSLE